jgi:hypothetical protein
MSIEKVWTEILEWYLKSALKNLMGKFWITSNLSIEKVWLENFWMILKISFEKHWSESFELHVASVLKKLD